MARQDSRASLSMGEVGLEEGCRGAPPRAVNKLRERRHRHINPVHRAKDNST